jgi:arylsulfatase A-like enzyme
MEERTFGGGGSAGIYRGAKFSLFEGGIRVPAMISWPTVIPQNEVRDEMTVNVDWFPTILDLCGIKYQQSQIEGHSLRGVIFENKASPHKAFCWYSQPNRWAVRRGSWKLLKNPIDPTQKTILTEADSLFLVDLEANPEETKNQASHYPEQVNELHELYQNWYKSVAQ